MYSEVRDISVLIYNFKNYKNSSKFGGNKVVFIFF